MNLGAYVDHVGRFIVMKGTGRLVAGDVCSLVIDNVKGADTATMYLKVYRGSDRSTLVASATSFSAVSGHDRRRSCTLDLTGSGVTSWATAAGNVDTTCYVVLADSSTTYAACELPFSLRPLPTP